MSNLYQEYENNHPCPTTEKYLTPGCDNLYQVSRTNNYNFNPTINLPSGTVNNLTEILVTSENQYLARLNIPINNLPILEDNEEIAFRFRIVDSDKQYKIYPTGGSIHPVNNKAHISAIISLIPVTTT